MSQALINFYVRGMVTEKSYSVRIYCADRALEELNKQLARPKIITREEVSEEETSGSVTMKENDIITVERPLTASTPEPSRKVTFKEKVDTRIINEETWDQQEETIAESSNNASIVNQEIWENEPHQPTINPSDQ